MVEEEKKFKNKEKLALITSLFKNLLEARRQRTHTHTHAHAQRRRRRIKEVKEEVIEEEDKKKKEKWRKENPWPIREP